MNQQGQIFVLSVIILTLLVVSAVVLASGSLFFRENSNYSIAAIQATNLAEAGIDKAVASLNASAGVYNGESETQFGPGSYSVSVASLTPSTILVSATGYIPNAAKPIAKKTVKIQASKGRGVSFVYAMLSGNGGISMGNGSTINGSIYSNNNISGGNNETIAGDVYVAGGTQPDADQQSDCLSLSCADPGFIFGATVAGDSRLDAAQSFQPSATAVINKVSLKLKKVGLPANPSVKIMADDDGSPDKNNVLTYGTLSASLVTNQYPVDNNWPEVTFTSAPALTAHTTYWIMIATQSLDSSNYWVWSEDTLQGYLSGSPSWSADWQAKKPVWSSINGDLGFKTWMGGVPTSISFNNGSIVQGNVHANTINGITVNKDAYYQIITDSTVKGTSYPNSTDPPPIALPISSSNISDWQREAQQYGVTIGDISGCPSKIGPGKIVGNLTTTSNCTITVVTPIWLTGNLSVNNSVIFQMDPILGSSSGVIIVDGTTAFQNGDDLRGTGVNGSYLVLLSTYNSQSSGITAINTGNSSLTGILYAPFGILSLSNNAAFKEVVAWQVNMGTGTTLTYDSGLISTFFSAGPSGSFTAIKGTYQLQ